MNIHIQHINNSQGVAQFVQIPVHEFDKLLNEYKKLKQILQIEKKINLLNSICIAVAHSGCKKENLKLDIFKSHFSDIRYSFSIKHKEKLRNHHS